MATELSYRPDIDGLRGIAVLVVVLFHAGPGLGGGYVGVDVFFVISGFLITSLIVKDIRAGRFSILEFWGRRTRRIVPAMAVMVGGTFAAGWFVLLPDDFRELGQSVFAQATMLANFYFWREAGYFAGPSALKPLLHTWSLAVEEQFYFLMPSLLLMLHRTDRATLHAALAAVLAASLAWSVYSVGAHPDAAFFLLPSRAWELLLGALLALLQQQLRLTRPAAEVVGWAGLAAIVFSVLAFDEHTPFPGAAALIPCLGTAAIIASNGAVRTTSGRFLSTRPMVFVGLVSYSFYLWHWPVLAYANYLNPGRVPTSVGLGLVGASFLLAVASWKWVEMPFRRRQVCATRRAVFAFSASALLSLAALGVVVHMNEGFRERFSPEVLRLADARKDGNPRRKETLNVPLTQLERHGLPRLGDVDSRQPVLLVIGDSHGNALMPLVEQLCREYRIPAVGTSRQATIPLLSAYRPESQPDKAAFQAYLRRELAASLGSVRHVLLVGRWNAYGEGVMNASTVRDTIRFFAARGVHVWIVRQIPEPVADVPRLLALAAKRGQRTAEVGQSWQDYMRARKREDAAFQGLEPDEATLVDPAEWFYAEGTTSRVELAGRALYTDDDHLSAYGAIQMRPVLRPVFERIVAGTR